VVLSFAVIWFDCRQRFKGALAEYFYYTSPASGANNSSLSLNFHTY